MKKIFAVLTILSVGFTAANAQTTTTKKETTTSTTKQAPVVQKQTAPNSTAPKQTTPVKNQSTTSKAPNTQVNTPEVVKNKFASDYPTVKDAKWEAAEGKYSANFKENGKSMRVVYAADGSLVRTWKEIDESALPASAKDYLAKNYAGQKPTGVATLMGAKGETTYEVKIAGTKLKFTSKGEIEPSPKSGSAPKTEMKTAPKTETTPTKVAPKTEVKTAPKTAPK